MYGKRAKGALPRRGTSADFYRNGQKLFGTCVVPDKSGCLSKDSINGGNKEVDMGVNYYCTDENGVKCRQNQRATPNVTIQQLSDITAADGAVLEAMAAPMAMAEDYIRLGGVGEFKLVPIPRKRTDREICARFGGCRWHKTVSHNYNSYRTEHP